MQLSQCDRAIAVGLSGTVQVAEQFPGVLSAATPRRAGSTVKRSQQHLKGSCAHHGYSMDTEWIGNDKSASRPRRHLGAKRPNAQVRPLIPPKSASRTRTPYVASDGHFSDYPTKHRLWVMKNRPEVFRLGYIEREWHCTGHESPSGKIAARFRPMNASL